MAKGTFAKAMPPVSSEEDGYVDRPKKSRRRDEYGHHALYAVRLEGRKVSKVEVKALAKSKAMDIYRENYFRRLSASIRTASSVAPLFGLI